MFLQKGKDFVNTGGFGFLRIPIMKHVGSKELNGCVWVMDQPVQHRQERLPIGLAGQQTIKGPVSVLRITRAGQSDQSGQGGFGFIAQQQETQTGHGVAFARRLNVKMKRRMLVQPINNFRSHWRIVHLRPLQEKRNDIRPNVFDGHSDGLHVGIRLRILSFSPAILAIFGLCLESFMQPFRQSASLVAGFRVAMDGDCQTAEDEDDDESEDDSDGAKADHLIY